MCGLFVAGRVIYTLGYKTGNPASVRGSAFQPVPLAHSTSSEHLALFSRTCQRWVSESVTHGMHPLISLQGSSEVRPMQLISSGLQLDSWIRDITVSYDDAHPDTNAHVL